MPCRNVMAERKDHVGVAEDAKEGVDGFLNKRIPRLKEK
jgi:hypothetical protein